MGVGWMRITKLELFDRCLLLGAPGIGKTEIVKQKAQEEARKAGKEFVDLRERIPRDIFERSEHYYVFYRIVAPHVFPEDLALPRAYDRFVEFLPPKVLSVLSIPSIEGVLFIDELTNVQRDDQMSMFFSLILEKEAGWVLKLSDGIKIVAAANTSEWSEIARALPKPLRNRMTVIAVDPPTVDEWINYMHEKYGDQWDTIVAAYLKVYEQDFIKAPAEDDGFSAFPTPRSWTNLAVMLKRFENADQEFKEEVVAGNVGKEVATRFIALMNTRIDVKATLEELKVRPERFRSMKVNERLLVLNAFASVNQDKFAEYEKFVEYLANSDRDYLIIAIALMDRNRKIRFFNTFVKYLQPIARDISRYVFGGSHDRS
jgi:hypothetical protein